MKNEKFGAEEIYLAPEKDSSEELVLDDPIEASENEDVPVVVEVEPKKNVRVGEIPELREVNRKVYRMSDGTEQAVFYPETVHVFDEDTNTFDDVDNTLVEEEDGRHLVSGKNHFKARFSREEENDELFSIESGMHRVTVSAKKNKKHKNHGVKPRVQKKSREDAEKIDVVRYSDVESGADYEYQVQGSGVKEEIVIKEKAAVYRYPFVMKCENVTAEFDETNKRIAFISNETGDEIFYIPAPFMTDANGITSNKVEYVMRTAANGDVHFSVNADSEWLNAERRAFPVVIDPQIKLSAETGMTTYSWDNGYMGAEIAHKVGVVGCTAGGYSLTTLCDTGTSSSMANATVLSLNTWRSGSISCSGDQVWYKFVTTDAGTYTISTQGSMDSMGYLYDASGCYITYNDDCNGRNFQITAYLNANATYYLMVRAYGSNTGNYSVQVAHETASSGGNTSTTPVVNGALLTLDNWVNDSIECSNDEKWYTFKATAGSGTYIITTKGSMDTVGYLYDSNNNQIAYNDDCNGLNFRIAACLSGGSTYYVKVRAFSSKTGNYTVGVTTENCVTPEQPVICYSPQRMYMSFTMPTLPRNPRIKKAMLKFYQKSGVSDYGTQAKLGLYHVTGSINYGFCTPSYNSELIDFAEAKTESYTNGGITTYSFDITTLMDKLSRGETSSPRLMLKAMDESIGYQSYVELYGSSSSGNSPEIVVDYESTYGVNTSYRTHTHELGRFGQGSIDLQCGNLMFESEDFAWAGNRMPVTIKHLYNSALANYQYTANSSIGLNTANFSNIKLGYGFKLNVMQSMIPDNNNGYVYIGENGEETYFKQSTETICCENGQCQYLYKDTESGEMVYNPIECTLTQGDEVYKFENGRLVTITHGNNVMEICYTEDGQLTTVIDGAGREFEFQYSNGFLTSITAPDSTFITYTYTGNLLNAVTYPNGKKTVITYVSNKPQTVSLLDVSGKTVYKVEYAYSGDKVYSVKEYGADGSEGAKTVYSYSASSGRTVVQTYELIDDAECDDCYETVVKTVYTFDDDGNIVSEYVYSEDTGNVGANGEESGINPHSGDGGAGVVSNINNLLLGHNFENPNYWYGMDCNCDDVYISGNSNESQIKFGKKALCVETKKQECSENGVYQVTKILPAGEYTFSTYAKVVTDITGEGAKGAYIRVVTTDGTVLAESEHICRKDSEYIRLVAPFELSSEQNVIVQLLVNGKGTVDFNAPQLENNPFANAYNMLENGNFEHDTSCDTRDAGWNMNGAYYTSGTRFNMSRSMCINGNVELNQNAYQRVYVKTNRTTRETFTLSGWAKGYGLPAHEDGIKPTFRLRAIIKYSDSYYNENGTEEYTADFSPCTEEWQLASVEFAKSKYRTVEYIDVFLDYDHNYGTAYFDDIQLIRNSIETGLSSGDFETESEETTETTASEAETETATADEDNGFKELTDKYGNTLTETTFTDGEFGTIYRAFGFTPDCDENCNVNENAGNDLIRETDARGNTTEYTVDEDSSRNDEVIDRCGNKTAYEYDESGRTTKVTSLKPRLDENGNVVKDTNGDIEYEPIANVSYAYDSFDNLTQIVRGDGLEYALKYNAFHNLESIGIKGKQDGDLIKYTYKNGNGRLKEMTYANGDKMTATYNGIGQMIAEKWFNKNDILTAHYKYVYDGQGNIVRSIDILARKEYNYLYEDGKIMQSTESVIVLDENTNMVISKVFVCAVRYYYDTEDGLTKKHIKFADGKEFTENYEKTENDSQVVKFTAGGKTVASHSKNDSFGRKVFDELQLSTGFISRQFSYHAGEVTKEHVDNNMLKSSPTTQLVSQIVLSGGRTISYEYDEEERITKVDDSVDGVTEYTYDALGQLVTETKDNQTVVNTMTYDNYGNILTKNGVVYDYDEVWKDKLVQVGDKTITYDAQGNPVNYLGHTLTWEKGRQLKRFVKDDGTVIDYTYNANGIRTSKTVDGIRHDFVLDGAKILREGWNFDETINTYRDILVPLYDNEDSVCGIEYNGTAYYFLKNLQGDIIAITDSSGEEVARYSYDAWGVCTVTKDISGCDIANINPFRYRSYYFDRDTKLYYLQSRYYDAQIGRFVNGDMVETVATVSEIISINQFSYCECSPINNVDSNGAISWKKILSIFEKIGAFAKKILEYLIEGAKFILGLRDSIKRSDISAIAKNVKRSPHRVGQNFDWIYNKVKNLKTKAGRIFKALTILLFFASIASAIGKVKNIVSTIIKSVVKIIADGLSALLSWLVSKGIKLLSQFIPALGSILGFVLGEIIGRVIDIFFDKYSTKIADRYAKKVNVYKFSIGDYFTTFFKCLA